MPSRNVAVSESPRRSPRTEPLKRNPQALKSPRRVITTRQRSRKQELTSHVAMYTVISILWLNIGAALAPYPNFFTLAFIALAGVLVLCGLLANPIRFSGKRRTPTT
jgi:hypothetical protein